MKKKAIFKDFIVEIKKSLSRFFSILLIVALGVAFYSGIRSTKPDMQLSADTYYDDNNFMDIRVLSTLGLTEEDVNAIQQIEGVYKAEPGYSFEALCQTDSSSLVVKLFSMQNTINSINILSGRLPKTSTECLVDAQFIDSSGYQIGDTITIQLEEEDILDKLTNQTFTITGIGSTPFYLSRERGSTSIGNGNINSFILLSPDAFQMEAYTEIYVTVDNGISFVSNTKEYESFVKSVVKNIESIADIRREARYIEIIEEPTKELEEAKIELNREEAKANKELDDAAKKLADASLEIQDGEKSIADAKSKLEDGRVELELQKEKLIKSEDELEIAADTLRSGETALNESVIEESKKRIKDGWDEIAKAEERIAESESLILEKEADLKLGKETLAENEKEYKDAVKTAEKEFSDAWNKIADSEKKLSKLEYPKWYVLDRNSIQTYVEYGQDAERIGNIGKVFPAIFFLVAALVSLTTMTRMVEEERTQIGTLKALGYSKSIIASKYIMYGLLATLLGSIIGNAVGGKVLPIVIITAYKLLYANLPTVITPYNIYYGLISTLLAVMTTTLATLFACYKELLLPPSMLMRPAAPKQGKRVIFERIPWLWKRLNFTSKSTIRNLLRYKKRFFMTVFGIGGCMSLLLVGYGLMDSIGAMSSVQYIDIWHQDASVLLDNEATEEELNVLIEGLSKTENIENSLLISEESMDISYLKFTENCNILVPEDSQQISEFVSFRNRITKEEYELEDGSVIITEKLASLLNAQVGDTINLSKDETKPMEIKISHIIENYMMHYVFMTKNTYESLFSLDTKYNKILLKTSQMTQESEDAMALKLLELPVVTNITYTSDLQKQLDDMLNSLNIVVFVLIVAAGLLAFVVLYNLNNININERQRELATLKVLGFLDMEVATYVYRENVLLTLLGSIAGVFLGIIMHRFVILTVEIDMIMFGRTINFTSFIYSTLLTLGFSAFVNFVMFYKLRKIDMVESLKSIE
jgi:putative ABC transport system permease protein